MPISESSQPYAREVRKALRARKILSDIDASDRKMQKKVREAQLEQYNYILVCCYRPLTHTTPPPSPHAHTHTPPPHHHQYDHEARLSKIVRLTAQSMPGVLLYRSMELGPQPLLSADPSSSES